MFGRGKARHRGKYDEELRKAALARSQANTRAIARLARRVREVEVVVNSLKAAG